MMVAIQVWNKYKLLDAARLLAHRNPKDRFSEHLADTPSVPALQETWLSLSQPPIDKKQANTFLKCTHPVIISMQQNSLESSLYIYISSPES